MEVHLPPELQAQLDQLVSETGCPPEKIIEDAPVVYFPDFCGAPEMLDSRYDDLKSGRVKPVDGEAFFESLQESRSPNDASLY